VSFTGQDLGTFHGVAQVYIDGQPAHVLDVSVTVVEESIELVLPDSKGSTKNGKKITQMNFGHLYFGQKRVVKYVLSLSLFCVVSCCSLYVSVLTSVSVRVPSLDLALLAF
jgi:hypothetical protein